MFRSLFESNKRVTSADFIDRLGGKRAIRSALRSVTVVMCVTFGILSNPLTSRADFTIWWVDFHKDGTAHVIQEHDNGQWTLTHQIVETGDVIHVELIMPLDNPDPINGEETPRVHPGHKEGNPLLAVEETIDPSTLGIDQVEGGQALAEGGRGLGTLVNPADDDTGDDDATVKPDTQSSNVPTEAGVMGLDQLGFFDDTGFADLFDMSEATYVQLHNPADTQSNSDGDDESGDAGVSGDGKGSTGDAALSMQDAAFQALVNPADTAQLPVGNESFVLLPAELGNVNLAGSMGSSPNPGGSPLNFGSFGAPSSNGGSTSGSGRPPRP